MKIRKIFAGAAAAALAVSSVATSAFAAAHSGSYSFSDSSWWTQDWIMGGDSGKPVSDLIGDVDPSTVTSITFTSDTVFVIGYNNTEGGWSQPTDQTSYTLTDVLLESYTDDAGETHDPALCLCLSKGDGVEYTINWTVEADASAASGNEQNTGNGKTYTATLGFCDASWGSSDWESSVDVTGDGTYSIKAAIEGFPSFGVFVVDIADLGADLGVSQEEDYDMSKCTVTDLKVIVDGNEIPVDMSKLLWGDPEDNGKLRIEIYNMVASDDTSTKKNPPVDPATSGTTLEVQFTISGLNAVSADNTPAESKPEESKPEESQPEESKPVESDPATSEPSTTEAAGNVGAATGDKNSPDTGIAGVAAVAGVAVVAVFGVAIAKKRK